MTRAKGKNGHEALMDSEDRRKKWQVTTITGENM